MLLNLFLTLSIISQIFANPHHTQSHSAQKSPLEENKIVPDVLDTVPPGVTQVTYKETLKVNMGTLLTPTQVANAPTSITWEADPSKLYTLVFVDPDAPSRMAPLAREFRHWLVVNIPGNDLSKGKSCTDYKGSGPPIGTGVHRYIFAIYEQPGTLNVEDDVCQPAAGRVRFSTKKFAKKYNLGEPVSANYFNSQHE